MTCGELRAVCMDLIGPHNGMRPLSAPLVDELIYKACHSIYHEIRNWRSRKDATINVVAGTSSYDLPSDFLAMESVVIADAAGNYHRILPIPFDDKHLDYSASSTIAYYMDLGSAPGVAAIVLLPAPTLSVTAGVKVRYKRRPSKLSTFATVDTEFTDIDPVLHLPLAHEAAWLYLSRQGSKAIKDFSAYHQYFQDEVGLEKRRQQETWQHDYVPTIDIQFGHLNG